MTLLIPERILKAKGNLTLKIRPIMKIEEYITTRLDNQIAWYSKKSQNNQKWYKRLRLIEIVCAASIPFLTALVPKNDPNTLLIMIVGILGILITIIAASISLYRFQENWINYRYTCETLKHEKFLYLTKSSPYDSSDIDSDFVNQIEAVISKENSKWSESNRKTIKDPKNSADAK